MTTLLYKIKNMFDEEKYFFMKFSSKYFFLHQKNDELFSVVTIFLILKVEISHKKI